MDSNKSNLKVYIKNRGLTVFEAAQELEVSRPYLSTILHGAPAGRLLASKIQKWSNGKIKAIELLYPESANTPTN